MTLATIVAAFVTFAALLAVLWRIGHRPWVVVEVRQVRDPDHYHAVTEYQPLRSEGSRPAVDPGRSPRVIEGKMLR